LLAIWTAAVEPKQPKHTSRSVPQWDAHQVMADDRIDSEWCSSRQPRSFCLAYDGAEVVVSATVDLNETGIIPNLTKSASVRCSASIQNAAVHRVHPQFHIMTRSAGAIVSQIHLTAPPTRHCNVAAIRRDETLDVPNSRAREYLYRVLPHRAATILAVRQQGCVFSGSR
jgi:hypothetical protein